MPLEIKCKATPLVQVLRLEVWVFDTNVDPSFKPWSLLKFFRCEVELSNVNSKCWCWRMGVWCGYISDKRRIQVIERRATCKAYCLCLVHQWSTWNQMVLVLGPCQTDIYCLYHAVWWNILNLEMIGIEDSFLLCSFRLQTIFFFPCCFSMYIFVGTFPQSWMIIIRFSTDLIVSIWRIMFFFLL